MHHAVQAALPADIFVGAAAVADWRVDGAATNKLKKEVGAPGLTLVANPDILASVAASGPGRPALVVGFAAETEAVVPHARAKRVAKGCDWILANDVGAGSDVMGGAENEVILITGGETEAWPRMGKASVAQRLARRIGEHFQQG
jgi:phosphopantothenoylcysteine decarboxylase/phosphopantothenate--cysteine ligase